MIKELKAEWVKRLRSGDYIQNRGNLKAPFHSSDSYDADLESHIAIEDETSYCCLGVLAEIMAEDPTAYIVREQYGRFEFFGDVYNEYDEVDDGEECQWMDFDGEELPGPVLDSIELQADSASELIAMNDGGNMWSENPQSFAQIADYIETNL